MKDRKVFIMFIVAIIILFISFLLDQQIFSLIQSLRNDSLDMFFSWILFIEKGLIYYPLTTLASFGIIFWKKRKYLFPFTGTFFISLLLILFFKIMVLRPRPLIVDTNDSFPAGHPLIFSVLPFLDYKKNKYLKIIWLIISCLIVFTRIWFGLHYLSDILASIIIIYAIAYMLKRNWKKLKTPKHKKKYRKIKKKKR